jgi:uncharacterized protein YjbI with pentapeptide repeats
MANSKHLAVLKKSADAWNAWRAKNPDAVPDLKGAYLRRRNLEGINFRQTFLFETNLRRADLERANLRYAQLGGADLGGANLQRASLRHANLRGANFSRTELRGADFAHATLGLTVFGSVDLSRAKGLDRVTHASPSTVGIDTLYRSGGNIPEIFLRGCGLDDAMIDLAKALAKKPPRYFSAFISFAEQDETFARMLHDHLRKNGVRVWFAPEDLRIGQTIEESIDQAIQDFDKVILVLSKNSIDRAWVRHEFERAAQREKIQRRSVLFPIRLDDAVFETTEQWAYDLRKRHIGDFRNWENPLLYQNAINRLLRDLNAE